MKKLIPLIVSCIMFSSGVTNDREQLLKEHGYTFFTYGAHESAVAEKIFHDMSEEEFTRRLTYGFDGCSLGIKIENIALNTETPATDYAVRNLLIPAGQRSYNVAKEMHAIKYEGNARHPYFDAKHPFYDMCEYMSKNTNWINDLLNSEDLHRIIKSLDLSVLTRGNYFRNNPTREELRLMISEDLKWDAEHLFSTPPESLKELIDTIDDPIKKYTETFLICHALACGTDLGNLVFHEEHMDRANKLLEHFGFLENGDYNMQKVVKLMAEVYITCDSTNYESGQFIGFFVRRLYRDDRYLEATRTALHDVEKKVAIQTSSFILRLANERQDIRYSANVMEMIQSFIP
jgi:hypothetical protein